MGGTVAHDYDGNRLFILTRQQVLTEPFEKSLKYAPGAPRFLQLVPDLSPWQHRRVRDQGRYDRDHKGYVSVTMIPNDNACRGQYLE